MGRSGRFCDIGTGGGFPGLPLGILSQRPGILLDSVKKKAAAVQSFIDRMELGNLQAKGMRSEELALKEGASFETVVARAVSSLSVVEELATPLLSMGGQLIAMRGTESQEQIDAGMRAAEKLGLSLVSTREFSIGDEKSRYKRSIFVFEKTRESRVKVPRRPGMAVKHPLA